VKKAIFIYRENLGNQMFEYALQKTKELQGCRCKADVRFYKYRSIKFRLTEAFPPIRDSLKIVRFPRYRPAMLVCLHIDRLRGKYHKKIPTDPVPFTGLYYEYFGFTPYDRVISAKGGIFVGYWQVLSYFSHIRQELLEDFTFQTVSDPKVQALERELADENAVTLHIRGGDYLLDRTIDWFKGIATTAYYARAMDYCREKLPGARFYIFTNDDSYAEQTLPAQDAPFIFVNQRLDSTRADWVDMMLMSKCKNHIIANSTFSWWGAWLHKEQDGINIAPVDWLNGCPNNLIPENWLRIPGKE